VEAIKKDKLNKRAPTCLVALKSNEYITLIVIGEFNKYGDNKSAK
jgi:hypothetical protein